MPNKLLLFTMSLIHALAMSLVADDRAPAFVDAARSGDLARVQKLMNEGVSANAPADFGITALWQAASKGHREVVEALLNAGADPNVHDRVWNASPLMMASDDRIVALLVSSDAKDSEAKLCAAAFAGKAETVKAIIMARKWDKGSLAIVKSQAELGSHQGIVEFLKTTAGEPLPKPKPIDAAILASYQGKYVSDRLDEIELLVQDKVLALRRSSGAASRLVPRDPLTFDRGATTFTIQLMEGKVVGLTRIVGASRRQYKRAERTTRPALPVTADQDDWTVDQAIAAKKNWPSFRGLAARGIAVDQDLPDAWNVTDGTGVRWKTAIPGLGNSSPIVWQDKVFVTTAVSSAGKSDLRIGLYGDGDAAGDKSEHAWQLLCLDMNSGKILWSRVADKRVPPIKRHLKSSQANSTPVTNGKQVVALFNSGALACYDVKGEKLWRNDLGVLDSGAFNDKDYQWGFASSPIIYENTVVVQCDIQEGSFIASYDLRDGRQIWKSPREELPSWGTPTVHETLRGPLLIANGTNFVRGYDARNGREIWRLGRNAAITVPTPLVAHDLIFVTSGYRPVQPIYAIRLDAEKDITLADEQLSSSHIVWSTKRGGPYLPTPLVYGSFLYTCGNNGILTCYDARTGKQAYRKRCGNAAASSFSASLVAADGKLYLTAESGVVFVVKAGPEFKKLAEHKVGEYCLATPAIAGKTLLLRTQKHLVAIGKTRPK